MFGVSQELTDVRNGAKKQKVSRHLVMMHHKFLRFYRAIYI